MHKLLHPTSIPFPHVISYSSKKCLRLRSNMCNLKTAKLQKQKFHLLKKCNHRSTIYPPQLYLAGASSEALCVYIRKTPRIARCFSCSDESSTRLFYYSRRAILPLRRDAHSGVRLALSFPAIPLGGYTVEIRAFPHR